MRCRPFSTGRGKDCMNSASYEYKNMLARRVAQLKLCQWNADYLLENLSREDHKIVVN